MGYYIFIYIRSSIGDKDSLILSSSQVDSDHISITVRKLETITFSNRLLLTVSDFHLAGAYPLNLVGAEEDPFVSDRRSEME